MLKRLAFLLLLVAGSHRAVAQIPTSHMRRGSLPAMIVSRRDVEQLATELAAAVSALEPTDSILQGQVMISVSARTVEGRTVSSHLPLEDGLDTLRHYLGESSDLSLVTLSATDARVYRSRPGLLHQGHLQSVTLVLIASEEKRTSRYTVIGADHRRVDQIADRIDAFGKANATWRGPEGGEMARTGSKVLALLLLPMALMLRERRGIWLLYPASVALFAASYLFPFAVVFNNLTIVGSG